MAQQQTQQLLRHAETPLAIAWKTGFWRRLPWAGHLALIATVVASAFMIQIIVTSDEQPIDDWQYQPTVLLSITYTLANLALQYALAQAITVAWWVRALRGDATVRDLHHIWAFGNGVKEIVLAGRSFNTVALAALVVTLVPINGPLLQRASVVGGLHRSVTRNISMIVYDETFQYATGSIYGTSQEANMLGWQFSQVVNQHNNGEIITMTRPGCTGTCKGVIAGAGYKIECGNDTRMSYNLTTLPGGPVDTVVFSTNFTYREDPAAVTIINYTSVIKTGNECSGFFTRTSCTLTPATIEYPFMISNNSITLDPDKSWQTDRALAFHVKHFNRSETRNNETLHGGFWLYLKNVYTSESSTKWLQDSQWGSTYTGATSMRYARSVATGCRADFLDPTHDIMSYARELAFRQALKSFSNYSATYEVEVQESSNQVVYRSQYIYLAIAVAITLLATLCVFSISLGWWHLGRDVSLSPIEVAKAFAAPALHDASSNAKLLTLVYEVGSKKLEYGTAWDDEGDREDAEPSLRFGEPGECEKPQHGQKFGL